MERVVSVSQNWLCRISTVEFPYQRFRRAALVSLFLALEQIRQLGISYERMNKHETLSAYIPRATATY